MATLDTLKGVEAFVLVGNQLLAEFKDDDFDAGNATPHEAAVTVSQYVQADDEDEFAVQISIRPEYAWSCDTLASKVYVMEHRFAIQFVWRTSLIASVVGAEQCTVSRPLALKVNVWFKDSGLEESIGMSLLWIRTQFWQILAADDNLLETAHEDGKALSSVGEIMVKVFRRTKSIKAGPKVTESIIKSSPMTVHAYALKGQIKSHAVT